MTEESKGAAVALPSGIFETDKPIWQAILRWEDSRRGLQAGTAADQVDAAITDAMLAFRAEGEADLRARIAEVEKQRDEAVAALLIAHGHIDMEALRISHCKDASLIDATVASLKEQAA